MYALVLGGRLMGAQIGVPSGPGPGHIYHGLADGSRSKLIPAPRVQLTITIISKYGIQDVLFCKRGIATVRRSIISCSNTWTIPVMINTSLHKEWVTGHLIVSRHVNSNEISHQEVGGRGQEKQSRLLHCTRVVCVHTAIMYPPTTSH